jgi:hypothetical protein
LHDLRKVIALYLAGLTSYFVVHFYLYLNSYPYLFFDVLIFLLLSLLFIRTLAQYGQHWDQTILAANAKTEPYRRKASSISYHSLPLIFPSVIQAYITREILSRLRNANFLRMYILRLVLLIAVIIISINQQPNLIPVICFVFCWLHYNHQFNEKYVINDSYDFINTLPISYANIWFAYFIAEYLWFLPILIICTLAIFMSGDSPVVYLIFFVATVAILKLIITIRILFLDNSRLAGYAYHVFIAFSLILIFNFYLVGPVVIFGLLVYIVYLSYKRFAY